MECNVVQYSGNSKRQSEYLKEVEMVIVEESQKTEEINRRFNGADVIILIDEAFPSKLRIIPSFDDKSYYQEEQCANVRYDNEITNITG